MYGTYNECRYQITGWWDVDILMLPYIIFIFSHKFGILLFILFLYCIDILFSIFVSFLVVLKMKRVYNPEIDREDCLTSISPEDNKEEKSTVSINVRLGRAVVPMKLKDDYKVQFQSTMTQFFDNPNEDVPNGDQQGQGKRFQRKTRSSNDQHIFANIRKKRKTKNDHEKLSKGLMNVYSEMRHNLIQTVENMKRTNLNELDAKFKSMSEFKDDMNCQILRRLDDVENKMTKICKGSVENEILKKHVDQLEKKMHVESNILKERINELEKQMNILVSSSGDM